MNKRKIKKWLFLLAWMLIIFMLSHQPNSGTETYDIIEQIFPTLKETTIIGTLNLIIRKLAHITEYFILTYLLHSLLKEYKIKEPKRLALSIIICFIYSITDEYHQSFIIGRTAKITDCLIDTIGGFAYIIINYFKKPT